MKFIKKHPVITALVVLGLLIFFTSKDKLFGSGGVTNVGTNF